MKANIQKAIKHLQKAQKLAAWTPSAFKKLSLNQAIERMRKVREQLWEEKLAIGSGHK